MAIAETVSNVFLVKKYSFFSESRSPIIRLYGNRGNYNEVLFIAFISYIELSKPICHSSQSVIVTSGIIFPHLKPLYFRPQSIPRLQ